MRRERASAGVLAIAALFASVSCTPVQSRARDVGASHEIVTTTPVIDSAQPDSVLVPYGGAVEVTLHGSGFVPGQPGQNTVHFNGTALNKVAASSDGQRIVFVIPDVVSSGAEAPPSRLRAGSYDVSVENSSGKSNAVTIRVYR